MGSIGHLRLIHTNLQQQPTQQQQLVQSRDLKSTANNALPITSDHHHLNGLKFSPNDTTNNNNNNNNSSINSATIATHTNDLHSSSAVCDNDDINSLMVPKSINFIIDRLSKGE